jgi:hypothetical protein
MSQETGKCLARGKASQQVEKHFNISLCIRKMETALIKENLTKEKVSIDKRVARKKGNHQTKHKLHCQNSKFVNKQLPHK